MQVEVRLEDLPTPDIIWDQLDDDRTLMIADHRVTPAMLDAAVALARLGCAEPMRQE